ncbi:alpha-hydroxy-acid oxidizing protein, partial [Alphaproteobacteria bacterium]|nr:alpha-hydroxy-acid oxidizing protein [Alphaproteobacteria bacterium]
MSKNVNPNEIVSLQEFYQFAKQNTSIETWDYIVGAADTETTFKKNRYSLDTYAFKPRVLRDVEKIDTSIKLFDFNFLLPVFYAPIGSMQDFVKDGALNSTLSAYDKKIFHMLSSTWSGGVDIIGKSVEYPKIYQLYIRGDDNWVNEQISKAIDNGFIALCLTVDLDAYGRRERDLLKRYKTTSRKTATSPEYQMRFSWKDVSRIKNKFNIPIILKGIATVEDAKISVNEGIDVIYISNHGGRQLDYGIGGADLINPISKVVKNKSKIFFDGGVLRGSDIVKAIALGADCVGIGRLQCYAAATNGRNGLNKMIDILQNEILVCMRLLGVNNLNDLNENCIKKDISISDPSLTSSFPL